MVFQPALSPSPCSSYDSPSTQLSDESTNSSTSPGSLTTAFDTSCTPEILPEDSPPPVQDVAVACCQDSGNTTVDGEGTCTLPSPQRQLSQFMCEVSSCAAVFASMKDLDRHVYSVHERDPAKHFRCLCGKTNPRKDNHERHVRNCRNSRVHPYFRCTCGHSVTDKLHHLNHVSRWRRATTCAEE
jgi:hypothetical protein